MNLSDTAHTLYTPALEARMKQARQNLIVVTDLNGTLLDPVTGSSAAARPALQRLAELGIPVIFNSSKTTAEMLHLRQQLDNVHPFITENGADLYLPREQGSDAFSIRRFGMPRNHILHELAGISEQRDFAYLAFSAMTPEQLGPVTGLARNILHLLMQRLYTEPLLWQDSEAALQDFTQALQQRGLRVQGRQTLRSGLLLQVNVPVNKATPLAALREWYEQQGWPTPRIVALGDGGNDVPLLDAADVAVCVRAADRPALPLQHPQLVCSELSGPAGWNQAMLQMLAER